MATVQVRSTAMGQLNALTVRDDETYTSTAIGLHWLIAALMI